MIPLTSLRVIDFCRLSKASIRQFLDKEHEEVMFEYIVTQAKQVAIGPLEYCGKAKVMKTSHGKKWYV